jgi:hypothetical protein
VRHHLFDKLTVAAFSTFGALTSSTGFIHACDGVMKSLRSVNVYGVCFSNQQSVEVAEIVHTNPLEKAIVYAE